MEKVVFDRDSARRIAEVVRKVESMWPRTSRAQRRVPTSPSGRPQHWQVTAVNAPAGTCTVRAWDDSVGTLVEGSEIDDAYYDVGSPPEVGTLGVLCRLKDGVFFQSGGAAGTKVKVSANDATADYLIPKVVAGTHIVVTELNDGGNEQAQVSESGTRQDATESLVIETRTDDPVAPVVGRIWLRTDL